MKERTKLRIRGAYVLAGFLLELLSPFLVGAVILWCLVKYACG